MKIALFSDIHLEHRDYAVWNDIAFWLHEEIRDEGVDLVVNAGDTHHDAEIRDITRGSFEKAGYQYIDVLGNHDCYGGKFPEYGFEATTFGDVKVVHGSMWTNFDDKFDVMEEARRWISDFRFIDNATPRMMVEEFDRFCEYVDTVKPDVVVSHFAPSPESVVDQFKGQTLNPYFCPDAFKNTVHRPKLWLHGHIHNPVDYVSKHGVRVVANPLGYPNETYRYINDYKVQIIEV